MLTIRIELLIRLNIKGLPLQVVVGALRSNQSELTNGHEPETPSHEGFVLLSKSSYCVSAEHMPQSIDCKQLKLGQMGESPAAVGSQNHMLP